MNYITQKKPSLFQVLISVIMLLIGFNLAFIIPDMVIDYLNQTGIFSMESVEKAQTQVNIIRGIGVVAMFIGAVWMVILLKD